MTNDLQTSGGRDAFERRVSRMVASGALDDAWAEIMAFAPNHHELAQAAGEIPRIDGWDQLAADCLQADESLANDGYRSATLLVVRLSRNDDTGVVSLDRQFHVGKTADGIGSSHHWGPGDWGRHVRVAGIDALEKLWRDRLATAWDVQLLTNVAALVQAHRAIDAALSECGLPHPLAVIIESSRIGRYGPGDPIPLPWAERNAPVSTIMDPEVAAALIERRKAENAERFQEMVAAMLAEYRELYRLVRLFPFYRALGRNKLGRMLDRLLHTMCRSQDLPSLGVGWRMSPGKFNVLLWTYAAKRGVRDVEATMSAGRVDALHDQWLSAARSCDFDLPKHPASLFEIYMTWGLTFGGPLVQDRWAQLKPFNPERSTAINHWSVEPAANRLT